MTTKTIEELWKTQADKEDITITGLKPTIMKKLIYVASPYSLGDTAVNVRKAIEAGDVLYESGYIPYIPHLMMLWHIVSPDHEKKWLEIGQAMLRRCDAVLRLNGESVGADNEVVLARSLGIPVYYSITELLKHER